MLCFVLCKYDSPITECRSWHTAASCSLCRCYFSLFPQAIYLCEHGRKWIWFAAKTDSVYLCGRNTFRLSFPNVFSFFLGNEWQYLLVTQSMSPGFSCLSIVLYWGRRKSLPDNLSMKRWFSAIPCSYIAIYCRLSFWSLLDTRMYP